MQVFWKASENRILGSEDDNDLGASSTDTASPALAPTYAWGAANAVAPVGPQPLATITGDDNDNVLNGTAGDDIMIGKGGNDTLSGGDGKDAIYGDSDSFDASPVGNDQLFGGAGNDLLAGGLGNDSLSGGDGNDLIFGGGASGAFYFTAFDRWTAIADRKDGGDDTIDGGAGMDTAYLVYGTRAAGITVDISNPNAVSSIRSGGVVVGSITGIEALTFFGGTGNDIVTGGSGDNFYHGGAGDDQFHGGSGNNYFYGGTGNDLLDGGTGNYNVADYTDATAGVTIDLRLEGTAQDTVGAGIDTLINIDSVVGSAFADRINGSNGIDTLSESSGGDDALFGNGGGDQLTIVRTTGMAATTVSASGGDGDDAVSFIGYSRYVDTVTLDGGAGRDYMTSNGALSTVLSAGADDDYVNIDTLGGSVLISLGTGIDTLALAGTDGAFRAAGAITVTDFATGAGGDMLDLKSWIDYGALTNLTPDLNPFSDGHLRLIQSGADTLLQADRDGGGDAYATLITFQNTTASAFTADNAFNYDPSGQFSGKIIDGYNFAETMNGSIYGDRITGNGGNDTINGGTGNDTLYGNLGDDVLYGNQDDDTLYGGQGNDTLYGGQGNDVLNGNLGNDVLNGNFGSDVLYGNQGDDVLYGNQDNDILYGGQGNDTLYGGQGDDVLEGGVGNDVLAGNLGNDVFGFGPGFGADRIVDFHGTPGDYDVIQFHAGTFANYADVQAHMTQRGGDTVITLDSADTIVVVGANVAALTADHFLFG